MAFWPLSGLTAQWFVIVGERLVVLLPHAGQPRAFWAQAARSRQIVVAAIVTLSGATWSLFHWRPHVGYAKANAIW